MVENILELAKRFVELLNDLAWIYVERKVFLKFDLESDINVFRNFEKRVFQKTENRNKLTRN